MAGPAHRMSGPGSLDGFVDKWRQRWPEWGVLSVFVPPAGRATAAAWFALLQELHDAAWGGSDPTPGLAKLAWWQEELRGWSRGARRHPLGDALQKLPAPWELLGGALSTLPATRGHGNDDPGGFDIYARGMLACEAILFDGVDPSPADVSATVAQLRAERSLLQGDGDAAAAFDLHMPLLASRPRRLQRVALRTRVRSVVAGRREGRLPALRLLVQGWRAARGG